MAAAAVLGRDARGVRADRAGGGLGRRATRARARACEDGEWVIDGAKQFITNAGTDISGMVAITAVTGATAEGDLEHDRPQRHARLRAGRALPEDGLERLRHAPADVHRLPRPGGEPARPARRRLQAVPAHPRHRPHRRGGDGRRARAGRARPGAALRQGAPRVRQADLEVPGDPGQARGHVDRDRRRAAARVQGGPGEGRRAQLHAHRGAGQAARRAGSRCAAPRRPCRYTAATASSRSTRCAASTATPRSSRSARAPTRCSRW